VILSHAVAGELRGLASGESANVDQRIVADEEHDMTRVERSGKLAHSNTSKASSRSVSIAVEKAPLSTSLL
jgi:hypothetical protein